DRLVLRDVLLEQASVLAEDDPGQVAGKALVQVGERRPQARVAGRLLDDEVEAVVRLDPLGVRVLRQLLVAGATLAPGEKRRGRVAEERLRLAQPLQLLVADPCRGEL